jgi:hypothetical protein
MACAFFPAMRSCRIALNSSCFTNAKSFIDKRDRAIYPSCGDLSEPPPQHTGFSGLFCVNHVSFFAPACDRQTEIVDIPMRPLVPSTYVSAFTSDGGANRVGNAIPTEGEQGGPEHAIDLGGATGPVHLHRHRSQHAEACERSASQHHSIREAQVKASASKSGRNIAPSAGIGANRTVQSQKL